LRALSELGVVRIAGGSEVLLPGHVSRHVEQQRAATTDGVRWSVPGVAPASGAIDAVGKYVFEREQKRLNGFDIPKHRRYDGFDGLATFAGVRQIDGQMLALVKQGQDIMVMPIDEPAARRLKRLALGQVVTLTPEGLIKKKGRRR